MSKLISRNWFLVIIMTFALVGCDIPRPAGSSADIQASVPPAIAAIQTENDVIIRLQPVAQQFDAGETTTVEIRVENVTNLALVDLELRFNPTILQVQDDNPNQDGTQIQPGDFLAANFVVTNMANNGDGTIRYILTQVGTPPATGSGLLASVRVLGFSPGNSELSFSLVKLASDESQVITAIPEQTQLIVNQPGDDSTPVAGEPTATSPPAETAVPSDTPAPIEPVPTSELVEPAATPALADTPTTSPPATESMTVIAAPVDVPYGATLGFCYRVQPYETFYSLTHKFSVSAYDLNLVNDLWPRGRIFAHQALFIPIQPGHGPNYYIVESGDTLAGIADLCRLPVELIARVNYIDPVSRIVEGQPLEIPIPPFPPPARFNYPTGPIPIIPHVSHRYPDSSPSYQSGAALGK